MLQLPHLLVQQPDPVNLIQLRGTRQIKKNMYLVFISIIQRERWNNLRKQMPHLFLVVVSASLVSCQCLIS